MIFILFSCEREICWNCEINETYRLVNKAYINDTILFRHLYVGVCGMTQKEIKNYEREKSRTQIVEEMELQGAVYFWSGTVEVNYICKKE